MDKSGTEVRCVFVKFSGRISKNARIALLIGIDCEIQKSRFISRSLALTRRAEDFLSPWKSSFIYIRECFHSVSILPRISVFGERLVETTPRRTLNLHIRPCGCLRASIVPQSKCDLRTTFYFQLHRDDSSDFNAK